MEVPWEWEYSYWATNENGMEVPLNRSSFRVTNENGMGVPWKWG